MLKRKAKLNYRRGTTLKCCGECDNLRRDLVLTGIGGVDLPPADRCRVIGLEPGRMYSISRKNVCDRFGNTISLQQAKEAA